MVDALWPTPETDDEMTAKGSLRAGGHTTVIQRVLERRLEKRSTTEEGTTATVAVMIRVLPPPQALLVFQDPWRLKEFEQTIAPGVLEYEAVADEEEALRRLQDEFRALVVTDSLELIR